MFTSEFISRAIALSYEVVDLWAEAREAQLWEHEDGEDHHSWELFGEGNKLWDELVALVGKETALEILPE